MNLKILSIDLYRYTVMNIHYCIYL